MEETTKSKGTCKDAVFSFVGGTEGVGTSDGLQNFSKFEASVRYHLSVLSLVGSKSLVIITLATFTNPRGTSLLQLPIHDPRDGVIVLIRLVSQPEDDIVRYIEPMRTVGKFESLVGEVLYELNGVVDWFSLSVSGDDEDRSASFGKAPTPCRAPVERFKYRGLLRLGHNPGRLSVSIMIIGVHCG